MNFNLNPEQKTLQKTVRDFCARVISPNAARWNKEERFPHEIIEPMAEPAHYFYVADLPIGGKDHVEQNLSFNFELSAFISVNRTRLKCDLGR